MISPHRSTGPQGKLGERQMTKTERHPTRHVALRENGRTSGLEVRQLRAFVTLVDEGSMTAVAQVLGVAQSTVSEALSALERALGVPMAVRRPGAHGIALTPAGRALLPHARAILASLGEAQVAVAAATRETRGRIEVVANESVSTYLLTSALGRLRQSWPNMQFAVTVGTCPSVRDGVANSRFDVGLLLRAEESPAASVSPVTRPAVESGGTVPLADVRLVLFSGPGHPLAPRTLSAEVPRDRLSPYPVFVSDASGDFQTLLFDFFRADGIPGPRLEPTGSIEAVKRSVMMSPLALGVLPDYALADELRAGLAHEVSVRPGLPRVRLEAMLAGSRPLHPAAAELVELLRTTVGHSTHTGPQTRQGRRKAV